MPGNYGGKDINIQDMYEAVGSYSKSQMTLDELINMERVACPGEGACSGMFTANTMASAIEAMGMSLPYSSSTPAIDAAKQKECFNAGKAIKHLLEKDIKPKDIMTRDAFENAMVLITILGGSTNAVLHLLAIANDAKVRLSLNDFERIGKKVPVLADLKPSGKYTMAELVNVGGVAPLMKILLEKKLLHGDCITVSGKTLKENLKRVQHYKKQHLNIY